MSRRGTVFGTAFAASLLSTGYTAVAVLDPHPRIIWNASASVPIGLYRLTPVRTPAAGALIAIMPPQALARQMDARGYLPLGLPMLKHIAAVHGATVCRHGRSITVGGAPVATALMRDRRGRPLPSWHGCTTLGPHQLFLLNAPPESWDSRYYGPISDAGLLGQVSALFTRDTPGAPLTWRGGARTSHESAHAVGRP